MLLSFFPFASYSRWYAFSTRIINLSQFITVTEEPHLYSNIYNLQCRRHCTYIIQLRFFNVDFCSIILVTKLLIFFSQITREFMGLEMIGKKEGRTIGYKVLSRKIKSKFFDLEQKKWYYCTVKTISLYPFFKIYLLTPSTFVGQFNNSLQQFSIYHKSFLGPVITSCCWMFMALSLLHFCLP